MTEVVDRGARPTWNVTTSPTAAPAEPIGFPSLDFLEHHQLFMALGPTGISRYWPDAFAHLHPGLATTDVAYNRVDDVWMHPRGETMWVLVRSEPGDWAPPTRDVSAAVSALRDISGLPASDVAAMLGLQRRRFYDLLAGDTTTTDRERWIFVLAGLFRELYDAAQGQTGRVRAALLRPDEAGTSLYDLVVAREDDAVRDRVAKLRSELEQGQHTGRVQRPSPRLKRLGRTSEASDFLSGYRERDGERN